MFPVILTVNKNYVVHIAAAYFLNFNHDQIELWQFHTFVYLEKTPQSIIARWA